MEKKIKMKISQLLLSLSFQVSLLDSSGNSLIPSDGKATSFSRKLPVGATVRLNGFLYRQMDCKPFWILSVSEKAPGGKDILSLLDSLITNLLSENESASGVLDVYRRILRHDLVGVELNEAAQEMNLPLEKNRSVLLIQLDEKRSAFEILGELLPVSVGDRLIPINRKQAVLIKDMENMEGLDELIQFAQAFQETLLEEIGQEAFIGIGDEKTSLSLLYRSYQEASKAIEVGKIFKPSEKIHAYRHLLLEKLLVNMPKEEVLLQSRILFNENTAKLFTPDMLHTIDVFFDKDLNLSDTARVLFVHRNTLVYRLDKIQKGTGLDLRHFNDAAAFKVLYEINRLKEEN